MEEVSMGHWRAVPEITRPGLHLPFPLLYRVYKPLTRNTLSSVTVSSVTMRGLLSRVRSLVGSHWNRRFPLRHSLHPPSTRYLQERTFISVHTRSKEKISGDFHRWMLPGSIRGSKFASGFTPLQPKPLGSILDLERTKDFSAEELVSVWDDYHLGRGHIGASMKAKLYNLLEQRAIPCPYFVIPLWKGSGYTNMFIQAQMPHMIITGLEDYKARGTQASPYITVTYYKKFAETKDLVLVRGDVVFTSKLTDAEAKWLIETAHSFYLNDMRYRLVERFNKQTHDFEFKDVLQALDMPSC